MFIRWNTGPLLDYQRSLLKWNPPPGTLAATTGALSRSFGTGKSTAAVLRFARVLMERPAYDPDRERRRPLAIALAPTSALLRINVIPLMEWALPRQVVVKKLKSPYAIWTLVNGVELWFMSGDGIVDSGTAFAMFVDEISYPCFMDGQNWSKLMGRLRAPGYTELCVAGISSNNPLIRGRFDHADDPTFRIALPGLDDAPIDDEKKARILSTIPAEDREVAKKGGWAPDRQQVYQLDRERHAADMPVDRQRAALIAIDPGRSSAGIVCQRFGDVLVVMDELIGYDMSTETMCRELDARGWRPEEVALDTQAHVDSWEAVRRVWPAAPIRQLKKRSAEWEVERGHEHVRTCLRDGNDRTRLKFHRQLWDEGHPTRGVVLSMQEYRYKEGAAGKAVRDDRVDHQCDVVRYAALNWISVEDPRARSRGAPRVVAFR